MDRFKMKLLIIDNAFNLNLVIRSEISVILHNLFSYYKVAYLKGLIRRLLKKGYNIKDIKVISNNNRKLKLLEGISVQYLPEIRTKVDRSDYEEILEDYKRTTKSIVLNLLQTLKKEKIFYFDNTFWGDILEMEFIWFFNGIFGEYELLKYLIKKECLQKIIFVNYNPRYIKILRKLTLKYKNVEFYQNKIVNYLSIIPKSVLFIYFFRYLSESLNYYFFGKNQVKKILNMKNNRNLYFIFGTKGQFDAVANIFDYYKVDPTIDLIKYQSEDILQLGKLSKLLKMLLYIKKCWLGNIIKINNKIFNRSNRIDGLLADFYSSQLVFLTIKLLMKYFRFKYLVEMKRPNMIFITNEMKAENKLYAKICRVNDIPVIYIPHAALPVYDEITTKKQDFSYIYVPAELDKQYLVENGIPIHKIEVTGRPKYEKLYKGGTKPFKEVRDLISRRKYDFNSKNFTILFTTDTVDYSSKEAITKIVLNSLKKLDLIDSLIIKIHPREYIGFYKVLLEKANVNPFLVQNCDILRLIKSCNVVICRTSTTTILESMIIGIPVLVLDFIKVKYNITGKYLFSDDESLIKVKNEQELEKELELLIKNVDYNAKYTKIVKELALKYHKAVKFERTIELLDKIL